MAVVASVVVARGMAMASMDGRTCGNCFLAVGRAFAGFVVSFVHGICWCVVELVSALVGQFVC